MVMVPQTSLSLVDAWLAAIMVCISIVILLAIHLPHKTGQCYGAHLPSLIRIETPLLES
jgi:hypothetical protein